MREEAKDAYAQTLYLLADTYSSTNNTEKATEYCTKTLGLQLEMGELQFLSSSLLKAALALVRLSYLPPSRTGW